MSIFRRRSNLSPKINITFFMTNLMLDIFLLNNFCVKSVFSEETEKTVLGESILGSPK